MSHTRPTGLRRALGALLALATALSILAGITAPGTAHADTGNGQVRQVDFTVPSTAGQHARSAYQSFVLNLTNAVAHRWRASLDQEQLSNTTGLVRVNMTVTLDGGATGTLILWITANNLYLRGYSTQLPDNTYRTYVFNDTDTDTRHAIGAALHTPNGQTVLPFGGSYDALTRATRFHNQPGIDRDNLPISFTAIQSSVFDLAHTTDVTAQQREVAANLMLLIQVTSEATRLVPVYSLISSAMAGATRLRISTGNQELENGWTHISDYAWRLSNNPNTPGYYVGQAYGVIAGWQNLLAVLAVMYNPTAKSA